MGACNGVYIIDSKNMREMAQEAIEANIYNSG